MTALARRYGLLILIGALLIAALASGVTDHLSLAELELRRQALTQAIAQRPAFSLAVFMLLYVAAAATALPGVIYLTIGGGLLFGPWLGGGASLLAATGGSIVVFLACRTAFGDLIRRRAGPRMQRIEDMILGDAFSHLLTLRLIPGLPMGLINVAAGVVGVPLRTFVWSSFLGMLPASLIFAGLGSSLGAVLDHGGRLTPDILLQPGVILPMIGLAILSLTPYAWRIWTRRVSRRPVAGGPPVQ
jgi:uncharacterized membrane protein YdjX (TVP38/TMEM64 family)